MTAPRLSSASTGRLALAPAGWLALCFAAAGTTGFCFLTIWRLNV